MCSCYNRRKHYPLLEKPGVQNKTASENKGKQHKLCDHQKFLKNMLFFLIPGGDAKKTKRLTQIQVYKKKNYQKSL